jgi:hypothetical protein
MLLQDRQKGMINILNFCSIMSTQSIAEILRDNDAYPLAIPETQASRIDVV